MGDEALRCSTKFRTKHWHDKVALLTSKLAELAGMAYKYEPRGPVPWNDFRPDGVLTRPDGSGLFVHVRTCLTDNAGKCKPCAELSGCSAARLTWVPMRSQQSGCNNYLYKPWGSFTPFCCKDGGFIHTPCRALLLEIAGNSGGSPADRISFGIYAFRCVFTTIAKGVEASILARVSIVSGCHVLQHDGTMNLASLHLYHSVDERSHCSLLPGYRCDSSDRRALFGQQLQSIMLSSP